MLISNSKKFIFIHIFKTAGTSVREQFISDARLVDRLAYKYKLSTKIYRKIIKLMHWQNDGMKQFTGYHKHEKACNIKKDFGRLYEDYFKFSFVRNPYDLLVSLYFFILKSKNHSLHKEIKDKTFDQFLSFYISLNPPLQIDFLMDQTGEKCIVDYIGRFENLQNDVNEVKGLVGINKTDTIKHRNRSEKRMSKNYELYYKSDTFDLINDYYKKDFVLLGYKLDGHLNEIPLLSL
jgi:hypothetical protein